MSGRVFAIVALLVSASVAAAPPPERTAEQEAAYLQSHNSALERDDDRDDSVRPSVEDADDFAIDDAGEDSESDTDSSGATYRGVERADAPVRTRYEYQRNLRTKAHRLAARRAALAHHRRYVHHRYLRNVGPFHQRNLRRPPQPVDDIADDDSDE